MLGPRLLSVPIRPWEVQPSPGGTQVTALRRPVDLRHAPSPEKIIAFLVHLSQSGISCSIFTLNLREEVRPPGSPADVPAAETREGPSSSCDERTFTDSHLTRHPTVHRRAQEHAGGKIQGRVLVVSEAPPTLALSNGVCPAGCESRTPVPLASDWSPMAGGGAGGVGVHSGTPAHFCLGSI